MSDDNHGALWLALFLLTIFCIFGYFYAQAERARTVKHTLDVAERVSLRGSV